MPSTNAAAALHERAIIIDGLFCKMYSPIPKTDEVDDLMLGHILASGVTAFSDSVVADSYPQSLPSAMKSLYSEQLIVDAFPDKAMVIRTAEDIRTAKQTGRVGVILSTQGLNAMEEDTRNLWILNKLDVRIMQLTYNERNALGCGCREPNDTGLTRVGQKAVEELNRLGVVVDLSHGGARTSLDAAHHSTAPVIASHVGVRALNPHPRNLTDELIQAIAHSGGVVGLCPHSIFVEKARGQRPTIDDFIDHIKYVVDLVGIDHAGIGTDNFQYETHYTHVGRSSFERTYPGFFGGYGTEEKHAAGFSTWAEWPNLTASLLRRGFSEDDTLKILGGNCLRVFEAVWR
jgi:membrane dipeptidase